MTEKTIIIAEAGVNHNGSEELALKLIDVAAEAGADYVKFQTFRASEIAAKNAPLADYQAKNVNGENGQLKMLQKLEISHETHKKLFSHCQSRGVKFISTPFDTESLHFLDSEIGVELIKIPSGEIVNPLLLIEAGRTGKPIILSTGMATLADIELALGALAYGMSDQSRSPSENVFKDCYLSDAGQAALLKKVMLLHCTTEYPAAFCEINLKVMDTYAAAFGLPVGLSDHSPGISIPIAAVARGARILEKHFTLDKNLPGPDHLASLAPDELKQMIRSVREVEQAIGHGRKIPTKAEIRNAAVARRSVVAANKIETGEKFTMNNICLMRPGSGVSPMKLWDILGRSAEKKYDTGDLIET